MERQSIEKSRKDESSHWSLVKTLEDLSSKPLIRYLVYISSLVFLLAFILLPPIFGIILNINSIGNIYSYPELLTRAHSAIIWSFIIAFIVSTLDLIAGLPLAWFIVRSGSKLINIIDT